MAKSMLIMCLTLTGFSLKLHNLVRILRKRDVIERNLQLTIRKINTGTE